MSGTRFSLTDAPFAGRSGRGVTVAVIDSGVVGGHPHIGAVEGGVWVATRREDAEAYRDRIGHGTAVAAAIREKAPDASLLAVRVFERDLSTSAAVLADGIVWAADHGARLINLSLGTSNAAHEPLLRGAVDRAIAAGAIVVAARELDGTRWLPGSLDGVAGVMLDWACPRDVVEMAKSESGAPVLRASGYPRPIPGVSPERNLTGISFAVANATGFLARVLEGEPSLQRVEAVLAWLASRC